MGIDEVGRARGSFAPLFFGPDLLAQGVVNSLPGAVEAPIAAIVIVTVPQGGNSLGMFLHWQPVRVK